MEFVQSFKPTLNQVINELSTTHNISTNIIQTTFNKNFHPSIKPHSGSHVGSYTQYTLSQKGSGVVNTNGNILPGGNNTNQPINQKSTNNSESELYNSCRNIRNSNCSRNFAK